MSKTKQVPATCEWKRDGDGNHYVQCGDFRVDKPAQWDCDDDLYHTYNYCPYCGRKLTVAASKPTSR
jgi:hypothetical protein